MRVELVIEGQEGVSWPQWLTIARACEEYGVGTLFRSDHYLSAFGYEERGSLDAMATMAGLAAVTTRLRFGVLVSPVTFRHPSVLAKNIATIDHISDGRVELGLGAGWHQREHDAYGFDYPTLGTRMDMLEEQLAVIRGAWSDGSTSFEGTHYRLDALDARPKPVQRPHPPLLIGGKAKPRTVRLAAKFADEYNFVLAGPAECAERRPILEQAWLDAGRDPATLTFSVMAPWLIGSDAADFHRRSERLAALYRPEPKVAAYPRPRGSEDFAEFGVIGTLDEAIARVRAYRDAGVDRIMLQYLLHDDLDAIPLLARLSAAVQ